MSLLDKFEDYIAEPGRLSRRSALGRLTKGCAVLVAALSGVSNFLENVPVVSANSLLTCNSCQVHPEVCCNLCFYVDCGYSCPSGYTTYTWSCTYRGCPWICGECYCPNQGTKGYCSFAYPLCHSGCPCVPGTPSAESMLKFVPVRAAGEKCH